MDSVFQNVFATVTQQHLFFGHVVDFGKLYRENALFTLVVNAGVKAELFGVKILDCIEHFLRRLEVEFVSVQVVHGLPFFRGGPRFQNSFKI